MSQQAAANKPGGPGAGYEVSRSRGACVVCQAVIEPETSFMAGLREIETGFERLDVCLACWPAYDKATLIGFWKAVMPRPDQKRKKMFVDDETLIQVFERLADASEPAKLNFRFVLGLILMRKRLLIYDTSRTENDAEVWRVRFKGKEQMLDLVNPRLKEDQLQDVSAQLNEILNEQV